MQNCNEYSLGQILDYEQPSRYIVKSTEYSDNYKTPVLTAGKSFILGYTNEKDGIYNASKEHPVIIFDDFTTDTKFVDFSFKVKSSAMKILIPKLNIANPKYFFYLVQTIHCEHGTHKRYWLQHYSKINVPVPPLPEQQRIVAKIEELFTELDNSLAVLKKVKEQLEVYSKSIYSHLILSNVEKVMVKDICNEIHIGPFGSTLHKVDYVVNGVPVINPSNIKNQKIIPDSRLSVTEKKAQELSSYKLQVGDIIMGRRGEMGRCAPVTNKENGYICGTGSLFFRLKSEYDNVLYSQILASQEVVSFLMEKAVGTTMKNLNEDIVSRILVPKITKSAGNKILETMQDTTKKCSDISFKLNQMEQQADALRQSILKKAFEGEL